MSELGNMTRKCDMCKEYYMNKTFYKWVGIITKSVCVICKKCAIREGILKKER